MSDRTPAPLTDLLSAERAAGVVASGAVGEELLSALVADLVPQGRSALVLGEVPEPVLTTVASRVWAVTALVDEPVVPRTLEGAPSNVRVAPLDVTALVADRGRALGTLAPFDVVVAPALDEVDQTASGLQWEELVDLCARLLVPGGTVVAGCRNPCRLPGGRSPLDVPHTGVLGPSSPARLRRSFAGRGLAVTAVHGLYGAPALAILRDDVAEEPDGELPLVLARESLLRSAESALSPQDEERLRVQAAAGLLLSAATRWVAVVGGLGRDAYGFSSDEQATALWLTTDRATRHWAVAETAVGDGHAMATLPATSTLETELRRCLAVGDQAAFRAYAQQLRDWVRRPSGGERPAEPLLLHRLLVGGQGDPPFLQAIPRSPAPPPGASREPEPDEQLARAFHLFAARRASALPGVPAVSGWLDRRDEVRLWLTMAGVPPPRAAELASSDSGTADATASPASPVDRSAPPAAVALKDRNAALDRALRSRDLQLGIRERRIVAQRAEVVRLTQVLDRYGAESDRWQSSRAYRLTGWTAGVERPRDVAVLAVGGMSRRASRLVRRLRGR
ncbi:MAG TPA: hypothetical protein VES95_03425 [Dermatophilaceae bacterium]|nr:hypothetical protein [Dermatophilaceae bacterium]